jgi:hypothetical protein
MQVALPEISREVDSKVGRDGPGTHRDFHSSGSEVGV